MATPRPIIRIATSSFIRPATTTQYAAADLVANTLTTAVSPLIFQFDNTDHAKTKSFYVVGARMRKSDHDLTLASFRLHLYKAPPTFTSSGDNGVYATVVATGVNNWMCSFDGTFTAGHADGNAVICVPTSGAIIPDIFTSVEIADPVTVYGLIEVTAAYTPASLEVFTVDLLVEIN